MNADHFAVQARVSAGIWGRRPRRAPENDMAPWAQRMLARLEQDRAERDQDVEALYLDEGGEA